MSAAAQAKPGESPAAMEGKDAKAGDASAAAVGAERPQPNGVHDAGAAKNGAAPRPPPDPNGRPPGPYPPYPPHPSHQGRYPPPPQGQYLPPPPGGAAGTPTLNSLLQNRPSGPHGPENGRMPVPQGSYGGYPPPPQQGAWGGGDPYYRHPHVSTVMYLMMFESAFVPLTS